MRLLLLVLGMFSSMALMAQNTATLKGKLVDSVGKQALKDASITILEAKYSTFYVFGLAKAYGSFTV